MTSSCVGLKYEKGAPLYQRPSLVAQQIVKLYYFLSDFIIFCQTLLFSTARSYIIQMNYSTVTDFARLRGLSTSVPRARAVW